MTTAVRPRATSRRGVVALIVLVAVAVLVVVVVGRGSRSTGGYLSTTSAAGDGSLAITRLLQHRGTTVRETDVRADVSAGDGVVVLSPASYSGAQLRTLAQTTSGPLILLSPDSSSLRALDIEVTADQPTPPTTGADDHVDVEPGCDLRAASLAGPVRFDATATRYAGADVTRCYGGRVLSAGRVQVLSDLTLLTNDRLADTGAAALDLNLLGTTASLTWLRPGADAGGASGSVWDALPPGSGWAVLWAVAVGALLVLWRGRRLGAPVSEPLPVVVRASEVVRGRGRLYARAQARDRAAWLLRDATVRRSRQRLGLPSGTAPAVVERAVRTELGRHGGALPPGVLTGTAPTDDAGLVALAGALADVEAATAAPGGADRPARAGAAG